MIEEKIVRCPACDGEGYFQRLEAKELCGFCDGNGNVRLQYSQKLRQRAKANGGAGGGIGGDPVTWGMAPKTT